MDKPELDDTTRTDMEQRLERVEYATVADAQVERAKEQLAGDLADLMADRL